MFPPNMACLFTVLLYKRLMWLMYCDLARLPGDLHRKLISQIYKHAAQSGSSSTSAPWRSSGWRVHLRSIRSPIHSLCGKDGDRAMHGPPANMKASDYICRVPRPPSPKHQLARQVAHLYTLKQPNISRLDFRAF